jgi:hypothetical protein
MENTGYEPFQFALSADQKAGAKALRAKKLAASESFDLKHLSILNDGLLFVAHPMSAMGH